MSSHQSPAWGLRKGFTLVELLVVIGIIAVLIAILLPTLAKARAAGQNLRCLANLRTIGQAMTIYATETGGYIPGSGATSGRGMFNADFTRVMYTSGNVPPQAPIYPSDYYAPLIRILRVQLPRADSPKAEDRYADYMTVGAFTCPSYVGVLTPAYAGSPDAGVVQGISYVTAWGLLLTSGSPTAGVTHATRMSTGQTWPLLPTGYTPRINKVGNAAEKIFASDGAKFCTSSQSPDYNLAFYSVAQTFGSTNYGSIGQYSDFGPWSMQTCSFDRSWASGNTPTGAFDQRRLAFRHGTSSTFRINAVFYDGHSETLDEMTAVNPKYWLPRGTRFKGPTQTNVLAKIWPDVIAKHGLTADYVVP